MLFGSFSVVTKLYKSVLYCKYLFAYTFVLVCLLSLAGCYPELSSNEELQRLQAAGPITPQIDVNRLLNAKLHTGYYRVIPGDILELQMPAVLRVVSADLPAWFKPASGHDDVEPYRRFPGEGAETADGIRYPYARQSPYDSAAQPLEKFLCRGKVR